MPSSTAADTTSSSMPSPTAADTTASSMPSTTAAETTASSIIQTVTPTPGIVWFTLYKMRTCQLSRFFGHMLSVMCRVSRRNVPRSGIFPLFGSQV